MVPFISNKNTFSQKDKRMNHTSALNKNIVLIYRKSNKWIEMLLETLVNLKKKIYNFFSFHLSFK
ncbi:MAG: hypothetical protein A2W91_08400 [Bacteroidetes bacterium GWF2_38_335]|nr:MAG: hypothetical protein A2W91_08400 [Bacteroidetes bacterium GWF2_38_335]OFY78938.1 MAG: hypothetical protein A2281_02320 [Bacteroidetes bacterium RIFOXYA12_FULL_38_20]HBS86003.1 hypothetical protein [Bacteroidales bacterium]